MTYQCGACEHRQSFILAGCEKCGASDWKWLEPPKPKQFDTTGKGKQKVLFAGMKCLPGQQDLFNTDRTGDP